ncbi:PAS domain-containing protein [Methanogenium marinum]|uniref:histidine kinase n=1 Tax=Methanogenium marinum TaxID=348610 RepID=A0A9Q4PYQ2_9EURY|nr:PAS domain-containing protein [Methanogenium marinum]MDE4908382.1 PAS domain-containing protein [Methanogenium marinum]
MYTVAIENIEKTFYESQQSAEKQIAGSSNLIDQCNRIHGATFDSQLEKGLTEFQTIYISSGGDPSAIDLFVLKEEMEQYTAAEVDLYIINAEGVIEYATYEDDIGIDFSIYPKFFEEFTKIRQGDVFVPDRSGNGVDKAQVMRKFAYLPTPDHQYVLEMSLNMEDLPDEQRFFTYGEIIPAITDSHPVVTGIRFYTSSFTPFDVNTEVEENNPDDAKSTILRQVREMGEPVIVSDPENQSETRYFVVDIADNSSPISSLLDFYAEVTYSTKARDAAAFQALVTYGIILLLGLGIAAISGIVISRRIARPVTDIVDDIDIIASGDLDHTIRPARIPELSRIADSTTILVTELKGKIVQINQKNRELVISEGEKTLILNAVTESVFFLDTSFHIIWVNAAGRRNMSAGDIDPEGCICYAVVHGEPSVCNNCPIPDALERHHPVQGTVETVDGRITEVIASPVLDESGFCTGIVVTALDVSDREAAIVALRTSEGQYRDLFNGMKTGFALIHEDDKGEIRFLTVNPAFARITEIRTEDADNRVIDEILPGRGDTGQEILQRLRENRSEEPMEFHSERLNKDLRIIAFSTAKENEAGVLLEDVTSMVELRQQQRETLEQIEQNLEHLAILNDEIRNPLMVILGYTELDEGVYADKIYQQISTINELVRRLDQRWLESEKVREFLRKHHEWDPEQTDEKS